MILDVSTKKTEFATRLESLRKARGLSQKALGTLSGVSWRTIQNIEAGISDRGASDLASLAKRLEVSLDELILGKKSGKEPTSEQIVSLLGDALSRDDFRADLAALLRAYKSGSRENQ